jgi:Tfp pilus assembly protein PilN
VEATSSLIKSVEELDIKIKNVKTVLSLQTTMQETYTYVFSKIPENIDVSQLSIEGELVQIEGVSASSESIRDFFESIKNEEKFENSELSNIQRDPAGYNFSIQLQGFKI